MKYLLVVVCACALFSCSTAPKSYSTDEQLAQKEADANLWAMIRYQGRAPEGVSNKERFDPKYDSGYYGQMKLMKLEAWYKNGEQEYFLVSKRAPSLTDKYVATGGKIVFDSDGKIIEYEELFRTWKMVPDTLKKRSLFLFDKMVKGESLKQFETRFSNGVEYIEFPDERTYYDKSERAWKSKAD